MTVHRLFMFVLIFACQVLSKVSEYSRVCLNEAGRSMVAAKPGRVRVLG